MIILVFASFQYVVSHDNIWIEYEYLFTTLPLLFSNFIYRKDVFNSELNNIVGVKFPYFLI